MTWRPSKSPRECSGINRRDTVSCFVIHKYGNGKQRLLVPADPCASSQITQSQRVHTKERRTRHSIANSQQARRLSGAADWNTSIQSVPRPVTSIRGEPFQSSSSAGFITTPPLAGGELCASNGSLVLGGVRLDLDLSRTADAAPLPDERPAAKEVRHGYQSIEPDLACRRVPLLKTQVHEVVFLLSVPVRPFRYGRNVMLPAAPDFP